MRLAELIEDDGKAFNFITFQQSFLLSIQGCVRMEYHVFLTFKDPPL